MKNYNVYLDKNGKEISSLKWYLNNPKELVRVTMLGILYTVAGALTIGAIASTIAMIVNCF